MQMNGLLTDDLDVSTSPHFSGETPSVKLDVIQHIVVEIILL